MKRSLRKNFFPVPGFLSMPSYGIDISDESLKFAQLVTTKHGMALGKHGEIRIPTGVIEGGQIKKPKKLEEILSELKKQEKIEYVRVSLPEEQVYIIRITLEKEGLKSIREGVELILEEHIPLKVDEAIFDYQLLREDEINLYLQIAAIQKRVSQNYLSVFENVGLVVQSMELEAQAIARAVIKKGDTEPYMIVDFGENRTGIFIVSEGMVSFTSTLEFGGNRLSEMIQKSFEVDFDEAEKIKKKHGLQRNLDDKEIFPVLLNGISVLRDEIAKHLLYWQKHADEEGKNNPPIKKIILCGGNANIIGLSDYFSVSLKIKVDLADVWSNIFSKMEDYIPQINAERSLSFASALGLALGDFYND